VRCSVCGEDSIAKLLISIGSPCLTAPPRDSSVKELLGKGFLAEITNLDKESSTQELVDRGDSFEGSLLDLSNAVLPQ